MKTFASQSVLNNFSFFRSPQRLSKKHVQSTSRVQGISGKHCDYNAKNFTSNFKNKQLDVLSHFATRQSRQTIRKVTVSQAAEEGQKKGVLFVCLGNICRSPTAEAMFKAVTERNGVADEFDIDSCGTGGGSSNWYRPGGFSYHEGDPADPRMTTTAKNRGVYLTSRSRPLQPSDFKRFDAIIAMDMSNKYAITQAFQYWAEDENNELEPSALDKVSMMCDYCTEFKVGEVPDPYYGGTQGFETVLDILDDACEGLLSKMSS